MCGRLAMNNPWELSRVDHEIFGIDTNLMNRKELLLKYALFAENE